MCKVTETAAERIMLTVCLRGTRSGQDGAAPDDETEINVIGDKDVAPSEKCTKG